MATPAARSTRAAPRPSTEPALTDGFATFALVYLDELRALDPDDVRRAPCLGYGRGGVAYVLHRAAVAAPDPRARAADLERAARWALAGIRSASAFRLRDWPRASYSRGLAGLYALTAIIAEARGDRAGRDRAIGRYVEVNHRARGTIELFQGTAGRLAGTAVLHRQLPDPRLVALGDDLAARLRAALRDRAAALPPVGLAHGRPGVLLGLLAWDDHLDARARAGVRADLRALAEPRSDDVASWAHGQAGMALLFARAHARLGDAAFLTRARAAAEATYASAAGGLTLVAGLPGAAYSLLAVADVDPAGGWRDRARELAARALANLEVPAHCPYGLWSGLSGLYCLVTDLARPAPGGFPIIEA